MERLGGFWFYLFLLTVVFMTSAPSHPQTFTNPLLPGGADPQMTVFEGSYYLTYTTGSDVRVRTSRSLATLSEAEEEVVWTDTDPARCCNIWAPELHRTVGPNGPRWYVLYTAGPSECCAEQRMHVLESRADDPLGPYTYKSRLFDPAHDFWAIDPTVLSTLKGRFVVWSGTPQDNMLYEKPQYLYLAKLVNPWTLEGPRVKISEPDQAWEQVEGAVNEGPAVLQRDGKIFLAYSGSGCWTDDYAVGMLVADAEADLLDPDSWRKLPEPLLTRSDDAQAFGPGHNAFFKSPDGSEDWLIYHANPLSGLGCGAARSPRAQKIIWGEDGLPRLGRPVSLQTPLPLPSGEAR